MLNRAALSEQIKLHQTEFSDYFESRRKAVAIAVAQLFDVAAKVDQKLAENDECGAVPSSELTEFPRFCVSFDQNWKNHEESRAWARSVLENRTTFAADGSQIPPSRDFSMPVAAVQVGWFENHHNGKYEKDSEIFTLSPAELLPFPLEARVGERRVLEEVRKIKEFLQRRSGWRGRGERMPVAFYDNTLLSPKPLENTSVQDSYVQQMQELIGVSYEAEIPVVGFTAHTYSRDLLTMLETLNGETTEFQTIFDTNILSPQILKNWGDRTVFCTSRRRGLFKFFGDLVGFVYLKTTAQGEPARVDIPQWVHANSLLPEVLDVVRAECIIGLGYPYALETADKTAVISVAEREELVKAISEFSRANGFEITVSRKAASKTRRR